MVVHAPTLTTPFQSTLPVRGATSLMYNTGAHKTNFNPRSP